MRVILWDIIIDETLDVGSGLKIYAGRSKYEDLQVRRAQYRYQVGGWYCIMNLNYLSTSPGIHRREQATLKH